MKPLFSPARVKEKIDRHIRSMTATDKILLQEEYRAEKQIAWLRFGLYLTILIINIIQKMYLPEMYHRAIWPLVVLQLSSIAILFEIYMFSKERFKKYYHLNMKYAYSFIDLLMIGFASHYAFFEAPWEAYKVLPIQVLQGLLGFLATAFIMFSILRHSAPNSVFLGVGFTAIFVFHIIDREMISADDFQFNISPAQMAIYFFFILLLTLTILSSYIARHFRKVVLKSRRQEELERFLPDFIAEDIISGKKELTTGGVRQKATILFADIRNFTSMSEKETPEDIIDFLNTYLNDMIEIIFKYNGTLDKIMGDGLMAIYGAPVFDENSTLNAVKTAIDMQKKVQALNEVRAFQEKPPIEIGVGIHTGEVILGNVGSAKRIEFTAIGDAVNTASRIEALTKKTRKSILISQDTHEDINTGENTTGISTRRIGKVQLRGRKNFTGLYEVIFS